LRYNNDAIRKTTAFAEAEEEGCRKKNETIGTEIAGYTGCRLSALSVRRRPASLERLVR